MADSKKRYIAVDLGATGGKVVLASVSAGVVTTETVNSFSLPRVCLDGQEYWDIYAAYAGVMEGLSAVGARKISVESIGIDAWGPGIVCLGGDGSFLGLPQMCDDMLSDSHSKFFKRMERRELFETTGVNVLDSHAALQLYRLRRSKSIALEMAKSILLIPDAVAYLLTGKRLVDYTSLYAAGLVDRGTKKLSKDVLAACKVRAKRFPSVVQPGSRPAKLTEAVAEATGLGRVPVVAVAGHDLASAAAALPAFSASSVMPGSDRASLPGILSSTEGAAFLRTGAVSVLGVETVSPMVNDQTFEMGFSNEAGAGGVNLLVKRIPGTDLLDRCLSAWRAAGRDYGPEDLARMAREGAPVAAQLDPEDPALRSAFAAPSLDPAAALSRYCSLRSMTAPSDDASVVRLIYTSLAEKIGDTFVKLQSVTPFRIKSLCLLGADSILPSASASAVIAGPDRQSLSAGTAPDSVFCQMVADECAVPVSACPSDAAVLGNVLVQAGLTPAALSASFPSATYTPAL